jgi:hypothetical protein
MLPGEAIGQTFPKTTAMGKPDDYRCDRKSGRTAWTGSADAARLLLFYLPFHKMLGKKSRGTPLAALQPLPGQRRKRLHLLSSYHVLSQEVAVHDRRENRANRVPA